MADPTPTERAIDRLAEIRARATAATPGPWGVDPEGVLGPDTVTAEVRGYERTIGSLEFGHGQMAAADREFVLNARQDVAWLLGELAEALGKIASAEHQLITADARLTAVLDACTDADQQYPTTGCPRDPAIPISTIRRAAGQTAGVTA